MASNPKNADIVSALRAFGEMPFEKGPHDPLIEVMNSLSHQAADEIEWLREIKVLDKDQHDFEDKLVDAINERNWAQEALVDIENFKPKYGPGTPTPNQQFVDFAMDRIRSALS